MAISTVQSVSPALEIDSIRLLADDFLLSLDARNRAPATRHTYAESIRLFDEFLAERGMPRGVRSVRREHVEAFITYLLHEKRHARTGQPLRPTTAAVRYRSLAAFFSWATDEDEIDVSPMQRMKVPSLPEMLVPIIHEDHLRRLIHACEGRSFEDRRDMAVIRLLIDTGMRRSELVSLTVDNTDAAAMVAVVNHGKGNRQRLVAFRPKAGEALSRYVRTRRAHPLAQRPELFIGRAGPTTGSGVAQIVSFRCKRAGIPAINPHRFRHTWSHRERVRGMSEGDMQALGGWRSPTMLRRYGASAATERAIDTYRRLSQGDSL